jgi:hypothetical protein
MELFRNDSRFKWVICWEPMELPPETRMSELINRTQNTTTECEKQGWHHLPLLGSVEASCVIDDERSPMLDGSRFDIRERYHKGYYERHFEMAGVEMPDGWMHDNTIEFSAKELALVERWHKKTEEFFKIAVTLGGSGINKVFPTWMESFCKNLIDELPFAVIYLFGDKDSATEVWEYPRTTSYVQGASDTMLGFKQALLMMKHADYVFGPDTGLLTGAGMFGRPKTTLFTLAHKDQTVIHHRNDHSLQSQAWCSPCYTLAYSGAMCQKEHRYRSFPVCTDKFDLEALWGFIETEYTKWLNGGLSEA